MRVRAVDAPLPWCEIPAHSARPCAVTLATQPADAALVLRPMDGARPDTVPVLLTPAARVRLPWHGAPYQPHPR